MSIALLLLEVTSMLLLRRPALLEHAITLAGLNPDMLVVSGAAPPTAEQIDALVLQLRGLPALLSDIRSKPSPGYMLITNQKQLAGRSGDVCTWNALLVPPTPAAPDSEGPTPLPTLPEVFDDFSPLLFAQYASSGVGYVRAPSFVAAVDEYYGRYEASRATQADVKAEDFTSKKMAKAERELVSDVVPICVNRYMHPAPYASA